MEFCQSEKVGTLSYETIKIFINLGEVYSSNNLYTCKILVTFNYDGWLTNELLIL